MKPTFRITDEETSEKIEYSLLKFPAGELQVTLTETGINPGADVTIKGSIRSSDQVFELLQLVEVLRNDGYEVVVKLPSSGVFVRYEEAKATGDSTPRELGWEYPDVSSIKVVKPVEVTTTIYKEV